MIKTATMARSITPACARAHVSARWSAGRAPLRSRACAPARTAACHPLASRAPTRLRTRTAAAAPDKAAQRAEDEDVVATDDDEGDDEYVVWGEEYTGEEFEEDFDDEHEGDDDAEDEEEGEAEEEELNEAEHIMVLDNFLESAQELRGTYDARFDDPRDVHADRFVWDYWYVPQQYQLIRTQAQLFFPEDQYVELENALMEFGQRELGCRSITPIWLSYYVDGMYQGMHADNPHGPWAFVLSLTKDHTLFTGGETKILQPHVLNYWDTFDPAAGVEGAELFTSIEPHFNRLTVFDPRFPHGVAPVRGTCDPQEGRLVLHGWFTEPTPFFTGALTEEDCEPVLNTVMDELLPTLQELPEATGTFALKLSVSGETGAVTGMRFLTDTLVPRPGQGETDTTIRNWIQGLAVKCFSEAQFPTSDEGDSEIIMPLVFE